MKKIIRFKQTAVLTLIILLMQNMNAKEIKRIISLSSSVTQQLYMLNAGDLIVGNTTYCTIPEDAKNKVKVGTIRNVNIEKVLTLKPDLVFATGMASPKEIHTLEKLGIRVVTIFMPKSFKEICDNFMMIAKLINRETEAEKIINKAKAKVKRLSESVGKDGSPESVRPKLFFEIGVKPIFTVSKNSYLNELIVLAGAENIAEDTPVGIYSREKVIEQNPEIILITTMGVNGEKEKKYWESVKNLAAAENKAVFIVDSTKICNANPVSFAENLENIIKLVNRK